MRGDLSNGWRQQLLYSNHWIRFKSQRMLEFGDDLCFGWRMRRIAMAFRSSQIYQIDTQISSTHAMAVFDGFMWMLTGFDLVLSFVTTGYHFFNCLRKDWVSCMRCLCFCALMNSDICFDYWIRFTDKVGSFEGNWFLGIRLTVVCRRVQVELLYYNDTNV